MSEFKPSAKKYISLRLTPDNVVRGLNEFIDSAHLLQSLTRREEKATNNEYRVSVDITGLSDNVKLVDIDDNALFLIVVYTVSYFPKEENNQVVSWILEFGP